jgi:phosphoglycolate phosphatase-like HAD superfamily hydrolase
MINLVWDIDGTLLDTRGRGAKPFCEAFQEVTGMPAVIDRRKFSGYTDYEIAFGLMESVGLEKDKQLATKILNKFAARLELILNEFPPLILADVLAALEYAEKNPIYINSIGSGNFKSGAEVKLKTAGLHKYFQHSDFNIATESEWSRDQVIQQIPMRNPKVLSLIIGDSPRDISSARKAGLPVLAVCTGMHTFDELTELKPDFIMGRGWQISDLISILNQISE